MDTTIRNLDEHAYRRLKARAALEGKTVGELVNEAIRAFLNRPEPTKRPRSLLELEPEAYPEGNERLSEEIDAVVYGALQAVRWEDFQVGQTATFSKTVTEADVVLYAGVTGDLNPAHVDREFAARTFFGERVAHGLLTAGLVSAVLGTRLPGPGCVFVSFACRFVRPVRLGDTITARAEVVERIEEKRHLRLETRCENWAGKRVLEGEAVVLIPKPRS